MYVSIISSTSIFAVKFALNKRFMPLTTFRKYYSTTEAGKDASEVSFPAVMGNATPLVGQESSHLWDRNRADG